MKVIKNKTIDFATAVQTSVFNAVSNMVRAANALVLLSKMPLMLSIRLLCHPPGKEHDKDYEDKEYDVHDGCA